MNEETLISVVMPAYNSEKYIVDAINSVCNQTYHNLELIVINDCSTDKTKKLIEDCCKKDKRIKLYTNEKNYGVSYSRNYGVHVSNGEWIAFIDSDDMWKEDKLQKQVNLLKSASEPILGYTGSSFIDENNIPYNYILQVPEKINYSELLKQNIISCSSAIIKKEVLNNIRMENDNVHEDFLLWLKILKEYNKNAYGINEPLLIYRISKNSKSGNKIKAAKMTYMVYKYMNLSILKRIYFMFHYLVRSIKKYKKIRIY